MPTIQVVKGALSSQEGTIADTAMAALPAPEAMAAVAERYHAALEKAHAAQVATLLFPAVPPAERTSVTFQAISVVYRTIKTFQAAHAYPETVKIVCPDDDIFQLYMVVWNLYYAGDKASRMNDGRWD